MVYAMSVFPLKKWFQYQSKWKEKKKNEKIILKSAKIKNEVTIFQKEIHE